MVEHFDMQHVDPANSGVIVKSYLDNAGSVSTVNSNATGRIDTGIHRQREGATVQSLERLRVQEALETLHEFIYLLETNNNLTDVSKLVV